jgi:hypothetical protein
VALLTIRGRVVLESAGPEWHLVGVVTKDKMRPNQLTLSRRRDALWSKFTGLGKRSLATLKLTDPSGNSWVLSDARIIGLGLQKSAGGQSTKHSATQSTYEHEQVAICYGQILMENLLSSTSNSNDDWT